MIFRENDSELVKFLNFSWLIGYNKKVRDAHNKRNKENGITGWLYYSDGGETIIRPFYGNKKEAEEIKVMLRKKNEQKK